MLKGKKAKNAGERFERLELAWEAIPQAFIGVMIVSMLLKFKTVI